MIKGRGEIWMCRVVDMVETVSLFLSAAWCRGDLVASSRRYNSVAHSYLAGKEQVCASAICKVLICSVTNERSTTYLMVKLSVASTKVLPRSG